ncbi:MAG TPA: hypothetical protein VNT54_16385 [Solirubrobacteraceae bacterium]|nr:hypothetical protein [Solirubrobacteraceae bacterium]
MNRLMNWGCAPVIASRVIAADAPTLLSLVSDSRGQRRLVAGLSPLLRPHASLGTIRTPRVVPVRVQLGGRDVAWLSWLLSPSRGTTEVDLLAQFEQRGLLMRLALVLGGRRWLRRRLEETLCALARQAHDAAEDARSVKPAGTIGRAGARRRARRAASSAPRRAARHPSRPRRPAAPHR